MLSLPESEAMFEGGSDVRPTDYLNMWMKSKLSYGPKPESQQKYKVNIRDMDVTQKYKVTY